MLGINVWMRIPLKCQETQTYRCIFLSEGNLKVLQMFCHYRHESRTSRVKKFILEIFLAGSEFFSL